MIHHEWPTQRIKKLCVGDNESIHFFQSHPPGGSGWIIGVGYYADNSFPALGSSDHREVRFEL